MSKWLHPDWKKILTRAFSVWMNTATFVCAVATCILMYTDPVILAMLPRWVYPVLVALATLGSNVLRVIKQKGLSGNDASSDTSTTP